jgi:hypothetical protein
MTIPKLQEILQRDYKTLHEDYKGWSKVRKNRVDHLSELGTMLLRGGLPEGKNSVNLKKHLTFFFYGFYSDTECYEGDEGEYHFLEDLEYASRRATIDSFGLGEQTFTQQVRDVCITFGGTISCNDLCNALHLVTRQEKQKLRVVIHRLKKEGLIESNGKRGGNYRLVQEDAPKIDITKVETKELKIKYPLNIEELYTTRPRNIILIAGEPDSGKSAFCLNIARLNLNKGLDIRYVSSEMDTDELIPRLKAFQPDTPFEHWKDIDFRSRSHGFQDLILPDALNIIDYYEITDAFYKIAEFLTSVYEKLNEGIAVIALQKSKEKEYGRGAEFSMEKPRLYLTLSSNPPEGGIAKIMKCKNWRRPDKNPNKLECGFKIVQGSHIQMFGDWSRP